MPAEYVCSHCGVTGCKLWRRSASSYIGLACINCVRQHTGDPDRFAAVDDGGFHVAASSGGRVTDQYDYYVPAVPCPEVDSYWGYTSVPEEGLYWWRWLPNQPPVV